MIQVSFYGVVATQGDYPQASKRGIVDGLLSELNWQRHRANSAEVRERNLRTALHQISAENIGVKQELHRLRSGSVACN